MEPDATAVVVDTLERAPRIVIPLVREVPEAIRKRLHAYRIEELLLKKDRE